MNKAQLILTGGTLSSSRNAAGLLEPSGESLDALAARLDFGLSLKPYIIDSIDFDMKVHYPKLLETVIGVLDKGDTPIVCGGTDTLTWYSTLLTKDLMRRGYLKESSGQKVVFLSSMKSIEEAPQQIEGLLKAGRQVATQKELSGGFALSAADLEGDRFVVHNVLNDFDKISASLIDALRSNAPVEYVINGKISACEGYVPPKSTAPDDKRTYARIAPPLLQGHDSEAVLAYLRRMAKADPPYDGIIIEGMPSRLHRDDKMHIPQMVEKLTRAGMHVMFCNPLHVVTESSSLKPVIDPKEWQESGFKNDLQKAGAKFIIGLPKDAYIDMMLACEPGKTKSVDDGFFKPMRNQKVLGMRYVPNSALMSDAIDTLAPGAKNLVFSALPGSVMPNSIVPALERHKANTKYVSAFRYTGNTYVGADGQEFTERPANHYVAGQGVQNLVTPFPDSDDAVRAIYYRGWKPNHAGERSQPEAGAAL